MTLELICPWCDQTVNPKIVGMEYDNAYPIFQCPECGKRWSE